MNFLSKKTVLALLTGLIIGTTSVFIPCLPVFAEIDYDAEAETRKSLPIQSNEIENWPLGPAIGAQAAIIMEAHTGTILYAKNIHEKLYPASTTKLLTSVLATEHASMDDRVSFSKEAVFSVERGSSNMGMDIGEQISMEQALYGVLVGSANEAANAVAEHISGSIEDFSVLMNQKAKDLGCVDSNFVNPNGLFHENHYTSAYDLAVIGREFFKNELLCKMSSTATYEIPPTATQPDDIVIHSKNKLLPSRECTYDSLLGSKTGFTSEARQTLVSCAKKDGLTLICVILKEESPSQFNDTIALFDYAFENFQTMKISDNEVKYSIDNQDIFNADNDVLGDSNPILALNSNDYIVLPKTAIFEDADSSLSYEDTIENSVAKIEYTYHTIPIGSVSVDLTAKSDTDQDTSDFQVREVKTTDDSENVLFVNVTRIFLAIVLIAGLIIAIFVIHSLINSYQFSKRSSSRKRRKKRPPSEFDDYNF